MPRCKTISVIIFLSLNGVLHTQNINEHLPLKPAAGKGFGDGANSSVIRRTSHRENKYAIPEFVTGTKFLSQANDTIPVDSHFLKSKVGGITAEMKKQLFDSLLPVKKISADIYRKFSNPVILNNLTAEYSGSSDTSQFLSGNTYYYAGKFYISGYWSLAGIPITTDLSNQNWTEALRNNTFFSVKFTRENFLQQIRQKLEGKFNPADMLSKIGDPVAVLKKTAEDELHKNLAEINSMYAGRLGEKINSLGNLQSLFTKDITMLRQQLLPADYIQSITDKQQLLSRLIESRNNGGAANDSLIKALENSVTEVRGVQEMLASVEEHKNKWISSGLIEKIKQWDVLKWEKLASFLNKPSTIATLAKEHLNLNGLQRLFLKVNKLNLGQSAISSGNLSLQHFLNKGVMTEFLNNNKYLMLLRGKMNNFQSVWDMPFTSMIQSAAGRANVLSIGKGPSTGVHSHISVMSFDQAFSSANGMITPSSFQPVWKTLVTTFSNVMAVGKKGSISTEISRSASNFTSGKYEGSNIQKVFNGDNLLNNMAFSLGYEDEYPGIDLAYKIHFDKTSNGYDNPGNPFLNGGSTQGGVSVKKSFLDNRLQVTARSDRRMFRYSEELKNRWRNSYSLVDVKWKIKKGQFIALRYIPNRMTRIEDGLKRKTVITDRFSAEANISGKIKRSRYTNYLNLSYQKNEYAFSASGFSNNSLIISSGQSLTAGKKLVYLNMNYNKSNNNSGYVYFNSSGFAETGITYQLFKTVSASSSLVYSSVKNWYQQAGIKQTLSGQINDRINLSIYVNAAKNLRLYQPLLYGLLRADITVQYIFKNKGSE